MGMQKWINTVPALRGFIMMGDMGWGNGMNTEISQIKGRQAHTCF